MEMRKKSLCIPTIYPEEGEKIIIFMRRHWIALLPILLVVFLLIIFPPLTLVLLAGINPDFLTGLAINYTILVLSIYYIVILNFLFVQWVSYYYDIYVLTNEKIVDIIQQGIFIRTVSETSLLRIQHVSAKTKGFLPTLFRYGNVTVETAGPESEILVIKDVPNPEEIADTIEGTLRDRLAEAVGEEDLIEDIGIMGRGANRSKEIRPERELTTKETKEEEKPLRQKDAGDKNAFQSETEKSNQKIQEAKKSIKKPQQGTISKKDLEEGGEIDL